MDDSIALMVDTINQLTELEKLVLSLRYVEECTMVGVANILDYPTRKSDDNRTPCDVLCL